MTSIIKTFIIATMISNKSLSLNNSLIKGKNIMLQHRKTKRVQNKVNNLITLKQLKRDNRKAMLVNLTKRAGA